MKKALISIFVLISTLFLFTTVEAKKTTVTKTNEKVTIHLFYASWCPHCHDFLTYFKDVYKDYEEYFEIKTYLVSELDSTGQKTVSIPSNAEIMQEVINEFKTDNDGDELKGGIPLIVIGSSFAQSGFGSDGSNIIEYALKEYENEKYSDKVSQIIEKKKLDKSNVESFEEALERLEETDTEDKKESGKYDGIIIAGIFVLLIGGFAGLVYTGRKK